MKTVQLTLSLADLILLRTDVEMAEEEGGPLIRQGHGDLVSRIDAAIAGYSNDERDDAIREIAGRSSDIKNLFEEILKEEGSDFKL
jgi:hypothetical protein